MGLWWSLSGTEPPLLLVVCVVIELQHDHGYLLG